MSCPPAQGFSPAGSVAEARFSLTPPPFIRQRKYTGRRAEGIRYERKVQDMLLDVFPDSYIPSPWLHFLGAEADKWRWCQPDGILVDFERGLLTVLEVKYSHTSDAWWQVRRLYTPVLQRIFPPALWEYQACEIVKWYDPATKFPEPVELASELDRPSRKFKVHIWRP